MFPNPQFIQITVLTSSNNPKGSDIVQIITMIKKWFCVAYYNSFIVLSLVMIAQILCVWYLVFNSCIWSQILSDRWSVCFTAYDVIHIICLNNGFKLPLPSVLMKVQFLHIGCYLEACSDEASLWLEIDYCKLKLFDFSSNEQITLPYPSSLDGGSYIKGSLWSSLGY